MEKLTKALMTDETGQAIVTKLTALSGQMHELAMATRGSAILFESESDISVLGDGGYLAVYVGSTNPLVISGWTGDNSLVTGHLYYLIKSGTAVASSDLGEYGGTAVTDTTLAISGAPADSKAVGDALAEKADSDDITALDTRVTAVEEYADIFTADVDESVQNWLDEHPEATTTVEDRSLTAEKLVLGTIGHITPQDFGAKGDGQTDDTQALQDAVNYGALNNVYVVVPSGTYITTNISVPQGSKIYGQKGSVLKRPNLKSEEYDWTDTQIKWSSLMTIQKTSASNDTTIIDGLEFDGNCWAMWEVSDGFKYEQAAFIACIGNSSYGYNHIIVSNCYFHDNFSSGVSVRSYIDCTIKNCKSFDCFKGLFTAVGEPMILDAHDLVILVDQMTVGFDVEVNFPSDPTDQDITSVRVRNVYSEGAVTCGSGTRGSTHIYENIYSVYTADGSKLGGAGAESLSLFKNCNFVFNGNTEPPYLTVGENGIIRFEDCTFRGDGANKGLVRSGGTAGTNSQFEFVGCVFANAPYGFIGGAMRYATITMDGCVFENTITTGAVGNDDAMFVPEILNMRKCVFKNPSYILKTGYSANFNPRIFLSGNKVMNDQNTGIYINGQGTVLSFDNDVILAKGSPLVQRASKGGPTILGKRSIITSYDPSVETIVGSDGLDDLIYEYTNADNIGVFTRYIHSGGNWILVESDNRWSEIEYSYATAGDIWANYGISAASGVLYSTGNSDRIRTRNFIRSDVSNITANTGYKFMVFAYDSTGTYVGVWNGTAYAKASSWQTSVNIADLRTANPGYRFYIMGAKSTDTKKISVQESVNIVIE